MLVLAGVGGMNELADELGVVSADTTTRGVDMSK